MHIKQPTNERHWCRECADTRFSGWEISNGIGKNRTVPANKCLNRLNLRFNASLHNQIILIRLLGIMLLACAMCKWAFVLPSMRLLILWWSDDEKFLLLLLPLLLSHVWARAHLRTVQTNCFLCVCVCAETSSQRIKCISLWTLLHIICGNKKITNIKTERQTSSFSSTRIKNNSTCMLTHTITECVSMEANLFIKTSKPVHIHHKVVEDDEVGKRKKNTPHRCGGWKSNGVAQKEKLKKKKTMTKKRTHTATHGREWTVKTAMAHWGKSSCTQLY